ncbi:MAG: hypothetical protein JNM80_04750 [Phycisphaerae bacterium]|nr:hypothetical protein [Phycisphaerae bacterium]
MKIAQASVSACVIGVLAAGAHAQTAYQLEPATLWTESYCLPPCACPFNQLVGPARGTFTLALTGGGGSFDEYAVALVDWTATLPPASTRIISGSGTYTYNYAGAPTHRMVLDLVIDGAAPLRYDSGVVAADPQHQFPRIGIHLTTAQFACRMNEINLVAAPRPCYPNCDESTATPVLNVNDFVCFNNRFVAGDAYANCDHSTATPILNVNDFICFLSTFAAGCT